MRPIRDLDALLKGLAPRLVPGTFVYATLAPGAVIDPGCVLASVREDEGLSVIVAEETARRLGLVPALRCAWITLDVPSDLEAVGLTAAVATALAARGIPCNVVAGARHDHLFVPNGLAEAAMEALRHLSRAGA